MRKSILITGVSKGIGRAAADPLAEEGWSVIGVARSSPRHFPGVFIETDLADQNQTYALAKDLAARGDVFGIVNNVGLVRRETIDAVDFGGVHRGDGFKCPPGVATHSSSSAQHAIRSIRTHH